MTTTSTAVDQMVGLEREMLRLFRTISHSKVHAVHQGVVLDKAGYQVLHKLAETGPSRAKELAPLLGLDSSTLSRHLSQLTTAGLVERASDPDDGRASVVSVSTHGAAILTELRRTRGQRLRAITADWSFADTENFVRLLTCFNDGLDNLGAPTPAGDGRTQPG